MSSQKGWWKPTKRQANKEALKRRPKRKEWIAMRRMVHSLCMLCNDSRRAIAVVTVPSPSVSIVTQVFSIWIRFRQHFSIHWIDGTLCYAIPTSSCITAELYRTDLCAMKTPNEINWILKATQSQCGKIKRINRVEFVV